MRSILLVIGSCIVLVLGFCAYSAFQSRSSQHLAKKTDADPAPSAPSPEDLKKKWNDILPGRSVWVSGYDEKGNLKNRFKSDTYTPQPNGTIEVTNPVAEFYMPHNQMMRLIGKTGEVSMPESASASGAPGQIVGGTPDRGHLNDVIIELYNLLPDALPGIPDETITTDNIHFDNATRLITTEGYKDAGGTMIAHDQVPVHMRSDPDHKRKDSDHRGYDFDGRGLRLRWNDKDGRLDLLEVAHGEKLIVKDASSASGAFGTGGGRTPRRQDSPPAPVAAGDSNAHVLTVSDTVNVPARAADPSRPASQRPASQSSANNAPPIPVPYLATFHDNVSITQGDEVLITADRMDVDFISHQKDETAPTTMPATQHAQPGIGDKQSTAAPTGDAKTPAADLSKTEVPSKPEAPSPASSAPTTAPTTRPASQPVVIRWTGKLVMLSAQPDRPKVAPGDAIVDLTGEPVVVRRTPANQPQGDDVRAARLIYHTGDGAVKLINSRSLPQVVISKLINGKIDPQSTVTTGTLDYLTDAGGKKLAVLTGPGHAMMPMETDDAKNKSAKPAAPPAMMDTHWNSGAKVFFIGKGQDELAVDHVDLAGDVDVKHPQLALQSQALSLFFAPPVKPATQPGAGVGVVVEPHPTTGPTTQPGHEEKPQQELKRVLATEAVHCVLAGQNGKKQTIDCSALDMRTARSEAGKFYARQVNASGAVHAFDSEQDLRADTVALTLKPVAPAEKIPVSGAGETLARAATGPTTQPGQEQSDTAAVELEKMVARDNVLVVNKDKSSATGSELVVTTEDHQNHVRLTGSPTAMVVDSKKNTVVGPVITFEQGVAHVLGAGKMHLLQEQADGAAARPMDVAWIDHADMNGAGNRVDLLGKVSVTTLDADGTVNVARGEKIHIDLMDKPAPATRPSTQPSAQASTQPMTQRGPATRPAHPAQTADSMQMGVMKDKDARTLTIDGNSQVVSTLGAPDGTVLRQFALYGPKIIYQLADSKELPAKTLVVPSAGKMFVGDHRPPEQRKANANPGDDDNGGRGDTAFQWSKRLVYSESQRQATLTGDVVVVHQPMGKDAEADRVRINSDQVTAWFEPQVPQAKPAATQPATAPTTRSATQPTTRPGQPGESLQLKHLTSQGHVVITRATGATLSADQVDYDPTIHWMTARGNENNPARYVDPDPKPDALHPAEKVLTALQMEWNTDTWNIKMSGSQSAAPR